MICELTQPLDLWSLDESVLKILSDRCRALLLETPHPQSGPRSVQYSTGGLRVELSREEALDFLLRRVRPAQDPAPGAAPDPRPAGVPAGAQQFQIPVRTVVGPNGAESHHVDLSAVGHLVQGGPEAQRRLEDVLSQVLGQVPADIQPGAYRVAKVR